MHQNASTNKGSSLPLLTDSIIQSRARHPEKLVRTTMMTSTFLLSSFLSFQAVVLYCIGLGRGWSALYAFLLPLAGVLLTGAFLVVAARATVMTWITVLVLLAFSGKRRRVLVVQGRKITADVAMDLVWVVFSGKGLAAVLCAAFISFLLVPR